METKGRKHALNVDDDDDVLTPKQSANEDDDDDESEDEEEEEEESVLVEKDDEDDEAEEEEDDDQEEQEEQEEQDQEEQEDQEELILHDVKMEELDETGQEDKRVEVDDVDLRKVTREMSAKVIDRYHPEMQQLCYQEVHAQTMRKKETIAFLTKYERTRVLAERTEELNANAPPYIDLSETPMLDNYHIAMKELENKLLPFIVRRVLPNGVSEYWDLNDLL